jgi:hypothetical protein
VREIRTLRAMWRGLETTHGSDTEALSTETESKQSRPNLRSIGASPRPYQPCHMTAKDVQPRDAPTEASYLKFTWVLIRL